MTIVTASTYLFESFTFFQSGWGNVVEIQEFDATNRALYCIWTYTAFDYRKLPPFVRKLNKALFQCKTLKKGIDQEWGVKFLVPCFQKKPFLANIECCPKFLEYSLTRGISRKSYPWYCFYRWSSSSVLCSVVKRLL